VVPEDVQALFVPVASHRLTADAQGESDAALAKAILHAVPVD
jgi:MoxR-like ATPase